jgi:hypothetical protein
MLDALLENLGFLGRSPRAGTSGLQLLAAAK